MRWAGIRGVRRTVVVRWHCLPFHRAGCDHGL
jgi:hypothetical protein